MSYDKQVIIKQFNDACDLSKSGWQAGLWPSWTVQQRVFKAMLDFGNASNNKTILDVGCGQGDMVEYIRDHCLDYKYTGIDISDKMIAKAKEKYPEENFQLSDVMDYEVQHDYVIATGTFNIDVKTDQMAYTRLHLSKLFALCKKGASAFFLSKLLWESYYDGLYYHDPIEIVKECAGISKLFTIDHCNLAGLILVRLFKN